MKRSKGQIMETYDKWGKTYRIEFDINVDSTESPWDNVFHFTTGGNCCGCGQRIPAFFARVTDSRLVSNLEILKTCNLEYFET